MLNSQSYSSQEGVLNAGQQVAPEADLRKPGVKVYYHQAKGARTHLPDGAEIVFQGGQYATSNKEIQAHLDAIADRPGSMVYTKSAEHILEEVASAAEDAKAPAADANVAFHSKPSKETKDAVIANQKIDMSKTAKE